MTKFFDKLPTLMYNGVPAKNFLARAKLSEQTLENQTFLYPYTMTEVDRPDVISAKYYEDSDFTWLIWLANGVVDPYYDLYIPDRDFIKFIENKYGSVANAQSQILYYRNNWAIDDSQLSISAFDSLLPNLKKYFTPLTDQYNTVYAYVRKPEDWVVNTNRVVSMSLGNTSGVFAVGTTIQQKYAANGAYIASGVVSYSNTTYLTVKHVDGAFNASNSTVLTTISATGSNSTANAQTVTIISSNIPTTEYTYWSPVSAFDYEQERNFKNKEITLIDNRYKNTMENELKKIMKS